MPIRSAQSPRPESKPALTRNPVGIDLTKYRGKVLSCVPHPLCPTMPNETLNSFDDYGGATRLPLARNRRRKR